jgi:DNA polymerase-4
MIEINRDSLLKSRPFVIVQEETGRSQVICVSRIAFREGIRRGMRLNRAREIIKNLKALKSDGRFYKKKIFDIANDLKKFSPCVETGDSGYFFLDMTGTRRLFGSSDNASANIGKWIREKTGLDFKLGLSTNKLVSRLATRILHPYMLVNVIAGEEKRFVEPVSVCLIPGIKMEHAEILHSLNILTMGQLADIPEEYLECAFGREGKFLKMKACGIDVSRVNDFQEQKRFLYIKREISEDTNDRQTLMACLRNMCGEAGFNLRKECSCAGTLGLNTEFSDGKNHMLHLRFFPATDIDNEIYAGSSELLDRILHTRRQEIKYLSLHLSSLEYSSAQMDLFPDPEKVKTKNLLLALDRLREKFGMSVVFRGNENDSGVRHFSDVTK